MHTTRMAGTSKKRPAEDDKDKKSARLTSFVATESVKIIAESVGIGNLNEDGLQFLSDEVTYRIRQAIQDSIKFKERSKRLKLVTDDVDQSLKVRNVEPIYGFKSTEHIPFRLASSGGRELYFLEPKEFDLKEVISSAPPKVPLEVRIKPHWLYVDGVQPAIPENPQPISRDLQKLEGLDPAVKTSIHKPKSVGFATEASKVKPKVKLPEKVRLKEITSHELSTEQQLYYKEISEACVSSDENRRNEALNSLMHDTGLHQMLPRFSMFISEGVRINIVQNNLALLIYLMRMVKSLLDNQSLYLEKYLHEFIPSLISCIVSKQLCVKPEADNHWALRDFAARLLQQICKMFNSSTNDLQVRLTQVLSGVLQKPTVPLATHYGAIYCLGEFGGEVVKAFVLPYVRSVADRLQSVLESHSLVNGPDRTAAEHVKQVLVKILPPTLKTMHSAPETLDDYKTQFGYLGPALHAAVLKQRQIQVSVSSLSSNTSLNNGPLLRPMGPTVSVVPKSQFAALNSPSLRTLPTTTPRIGVPFSGQTLNVPMVPQPPRLQFFNMAQSAKQQQPSTIFVTTTTAPSTPTVRLVQKTQQPGSPAPRIIYLSGTSGNAPSASVSAPGGGASASSSSLQSIPPPVSGSAVATESEIDQSGEPQQPEQVTYQPEDYLNNA